MAHWLLRERMAEHNEDGRPRQEHSRREQDRPEQNKSHDEAGMRGERARERATRPERAGAAARERACGGVRGAQPLGKDR